ncbi:prophage endopeptidase tail family protein [Priestia megaterium]
MPDMFIWSLDKTKKERLTQYDDLVRKWKVNNLNAISFSIFRDELNEHAFDLMEEKCLIEYDGTTYTIEDLDKTPIGDTQLATVTCEHVFYDHFMNRTYVYSALSTAKRSLNAYMSFIIPDTGYTFSVIDSFDSKEIENFGGGNPLELFKKLLETFEAEFTVEGTEIRLYNRLGSQIAYPFRSRHNLSDITKSGSARNLSTYIRGFGKEYEEKDLLSGVQKNFTNHTGVWQDSSEPFYWTSDKNMTFDLVYTGTGINFHTYQAPDGGVWEFTLDGNAENKATLSMWAKTEAYMDVDLFRDAEEGDHVIKVKFLGADESNAPTGGVAKGYVRFVTGTGPTFKKTFESYRLRKDDEKYMAVAEYTSPLAAKYGIRVQAPEFDDRFTDRTALLEHIKGILNDKLEISHEMTFIELQKSGYPSPKPRIGDSVPYIVEELGLMVPDIRIMEIDEYPEDFKSSTLVLGNGRDDYGEAVFNSAKQQLDQIFDSRKGKIKNNVLEEVVKRATEALTNSLTQLEYPVGMGILARDPNDYNKFVVFRSSGIGITTNGGLTYDNALTALGLNASVIYTGQLNTNNVQIVGDEALFYIDGTEFLAIDPANQNKYVRITPGNIYSALGAMTIERPDGYKVVNNGILNREFNIQGALPSFTSPGVTTQGYFFMTTSDQKQDVQYYSLKHEGRFLKVMFSALTQYSTVGTVVTVESVGSNGQVLASHTSYETSEDVGQNNVMSVDLGTPTGQAVGFYIRFRSLIDNREARVRIIRIWLEQ